MMQGSCVCVCSCVSMCLFVHITFTITKTFSKQISLKHNGKSKTKKIFEDDLEEHDLDDDDREDSDSGWVPTMLVVLNILLVVLDINETLLFRKYRPDTRDYTTAKFRPFLADFIQRLLQLRRSGIIHLAVWCGAWTHSRENELLELLEQVGLRAEDSGRGSKRIKKNLDWHFRSLPGCKTKKTFANNTGKFIVIKPISHLRAMLPQYKNIVLFDNNIEKCLGYSQKPNCRGSNSPTEYIIVKSFRGNVNDNELQFGVGQGCTQLFKHIDDYKHERDSRSVAL